MTDEESKNENRNINDNNVARKREQHTNQQLNENTSTSKPMHRCVSICTDGDGDGFKENVQVNKSQSMTRKRLRPEILSDGSSENKSVLLSLLHKSKKREVIRNVDTVPSKNDGMDFAREKPSVRTVSTITRHLHLPIPSKANEHILLNDNSLCKDHEMIFSPSSPVRSVVSCDGSQYDLEMCDNSESQHDGSNDTSTALNSQVKDNLAASSADPVLHHTNEDICPTLPENLQLHMRAVRIEASLAPMKPLLTRLMTHPTYNRKGTFNAPVDHIALRLKDYTNIVKEPMDLGTIKNNLLSNIYLSHEGVASDIRLCFQNALMFNPPTHPVHEAAKSLLSFFNSNYALILEGKSKKGDPAHIHACLQPAPHACQACDGRICKICDEGCQALEPTLVICAGAQCAGAKIRRGIQYYCSPDGSKSWCQRCYTTLPAVLPNDDTEKNDVPQYKRNLLKRRNDEDIVERWLTCGTCSAGVHECCAFVDEFVVDSDIYQCPSCRKSLLPVTNSTKYVPSEPIIPADAYTFLSGEVEPQIRKHAFWNSCFDSRTLPSCQIAEFIESKVQQTMVALKCPSHAEKTMTVRVISENEKTFNVPDVVKWHFKRARKSHRSQTMENVCEAEDTSSEVSYESKVIALFQRIDAMDVCLFSMFVQEYNDDEDKKRVYIAYIDSVEHLRPRQLRTFVYHEILVAYFATARARGFKYGHIWSCPPSRGNSFVFWGHPSSQRTPTKDRLLSWYHRAIHLGVGKGVITDIQSLYEFSFKEFDHSKTNVEADSKARTHPIMVSPPVLEGDFWIEEANRILGNVVARYFRSKNSATHCGHDRFNPDELFSSDSSKCPAMHVVTVLQNDIMVHPSALAFSRPVNAKALKLHDYHDVIKKPMDLGTITIQCLQGEYSTFSEVVADIKLVFNNAMRYNPPGHIVHNLASEMIEYSMNQLDTLVKYWLSLGVKAHNSDSVDVDSYGMLSMRLGTSIMSDALLSKGVSKSCQQQAADTDEEEKKYLRLLSGGPLAVAKCMAGDDVWLLDKRHNHKSTGKNKNVKKECVKLACDGLMKQQESWLCDELSVIVRRLRTDFFVCKLFQEETTSDARKAKEDDFKAYIAGYDFSSTVKTSKTAGPIKAGVADTRTGLLEFSQYRNFQFDTVRRAKYSTAMLLHYLRDDNGPGIIPTCTRCKSEINAVRWRKMNKAFDERRRASQTISIRTTSVEMNREELCTSCYRESGTGDTHLPIRVTFKKAEAKKKNT